MYNLISPKTPPLEDYDNVSSHRQAASKMRLSELRPDVAIAYESYIANARTMKSEPSRV